MTPWRVVAVDAIPGWDWQVERRILAEAGAELELLACQSEAEVVAGVREADVIFSQLNAEISGQALAAAPRLRAVIVCATGYDHVDLAAASRLGIAVANVHGYCTEEVSDHALALLLAVSRKLFPLARQVRAGEWNAQALRPVHRYQGQTLGVYGFGKIARRFVAKAQPLGMRVLVLDPYVSPAEMAAAGVEPARDLDQLLAEADYISLHVPLTPQTRHVINADNLARMKPGAYLINCSRGDLVDEKALADALRSGRLAGAALDVLSREPADPSHPLLALDNVIVTPHAAWFSVEAEEELSRRAAIAAVAALQGSLPPQTVNPECAKASGWTT